MGLNMTITKKKTECQRPSPSPFFRKRGWGENKRWTLLEFFLRWPSLCYLFLEDTKKHDHLQKLVLVKINWLDKVLLLLHNKIDDSQYDSMRENGE